MVNATLKNMKKYQGTPGLLAISPYTGEEYSATVGDYFWAPSKLQSQGFNWQSNEAG